MGVPKRIVIWSDIPSHHQAPWIKLLQTEHGLDLTYVVMESIQASERAAQGWPADDLSMIDLRVMPPADEIKQLVAKDKGHTLHVITGGFAWPTSRLALKECLRTGADFAILAEPPFPYGKFYRAKNALQKLFCQIRGTRVKAIWAIGRIAYDFYRGIGYRPDQVFEWAYFPPVPATLPQREPRNVPRIFYIGQFNKRKGVDDLTQALDHLRGEKWTAQLVGGGDLREFVEQHIDAALLTDRVELLPFQPYGQAMAMLAQSDLVVVPSRHDGWGAVVNEAMGYGIPVVCTDRCGSLDLVTRPELGTVCKVGSLSLAEAMRPWIQRGPLAEADREKTHAWASRAISPKTGAAYFVDLLKFAYGAASRPSKPWA